MKNDIAKRAFLLLLIACFALLCALYVGRGVVDDTFAPGFNVLENDSLSMELLGGGAVRIEGEGKLSRVDLDILLLRSDLPSDDVTDIIIGDQITELGYNVIQKYPSLQTLKLGRALETLHHGAVNGCTALQYVYLPGALTSVGSDFLYDARALVVTDGPADALPRLDNVAPERVLAGVRSYEDFAAKRAETPFASFPSTALYTEDPQAGREPLALHAGYLQYGPYATLPAGSYAVEVRGRGLDGLAGYTFDAYANGVNYPVEDVELEAGRIRYRTAFAETTYNVEFRTYNPSAEIIEIDGIDVYPLDEALPSVLALWWQGEA